MDSLAIAIFDDKFKSYLLQQMKASLGEYWGEVWTEGSRFYIDSVSLAKRLGMRHNNCIKMIKTMTKKNVVQKSPSQIYSKEYLDDLYDKPIIARSSTGSKGRGNINKHYIYTKFVEQVLLKNAPLELFNDNFKRAELKNYLYEINDRLDPIRYMIDKHIIETKIKQIQETQEQKKLPKPKRVRIAVADENNNITEKLLPVSDDSLKDRLFSRMTYIHFQLPKIIKKSNDFMNLSQESGLEWEDFFRFGAYDSIDIEKCRELLEALEDQRRQQKIAASQWGEDSIFAEWEREQKLSEAFLSGFH
ncbi:hypothetical protein [Caudoviricetes sp.]|nr:hypothetical protein [Caudoviricetes sp.]